MLDELDGYRDRVRAEDLRIRIGGTQSPAGEPRVLLSIDRRRVFGPVDELHLTATDARDLAARILRMAEHVGRDDAR